MSAVETLRKARELLTPEGAWIQGTAARAADRQQVEPDGSNAVCWCSMGALSASGDWVRARTLLLRSIGGSRSLVDWNDAPERTHAEVLAAFDRAIVLAEASEGVPQ